MSWIGWIVFGALAGWVASLVAGGDRRRGCLVTTVTGVLGAVLGGFIYRAVTHKPWDFSWDWGSFGVAVLGSLLLLVIVSLLTRRR